MTKSLPALIDGIKPSDPTSAAAASLYGLFLILSFLVSGGCEKDIREDIAIQVWSNHHVKDSIEELRNKERVEYGPRPTPAPGTTWENDKKYHPCVIETNGYSPINSTVYQLFCNCYRVILSACGGESRYAFDGFTE